MFDFSKISAEDINPDWILSRISSADIFTFYFGKFELNKAYSSKLRKDNNPSIGFYVGKKGQLIYNDFSTGEKLNCFSFVQKLYNLNFREALNLIASDFGLTSIRSKVPLQVFKDANELDIIQKKETIIQFIPDKWKDRHLKYWRLYEITKKELELENVFPVKNLFINKKEIKNINNDLQFAYVEKDVGVKIYTPYNKRIKHITNIPLSIPFGLKNLKYQSNTIYITKAKKDLIILKKFFTDVIATQNESESSISNETEELIKNFKNKIIIWDNDETGVNNCKKFNSRGYGYFNIPKEELKKGIKDIADYVEWYGLIGLEQLFLQKNLI